jgi:excisionase family DNA binding protein
MATETQHLIHTRLLTPTETAAILNCSRRWIYRLVAEGELPAVRLGDSARAPMRLRSRDLSAFLKETSQHPPVAA